MKAEQIVYNRFFKPFENKKTAQNIGVELEFPLVNADGNEIDKEYAASFMQHLQNMGYKCVLRGENGEPLFMENRHGDCMSFDNSYNNFEFSLNYGDDLTVLADRFYSYLPFVQEFFKKRNMKLVGRGTNPNKNNISALHVPFSTYNMVDEFLHKGNARHNYPDFPAYLSSVQTHLDVSLTELPQAYSFFAKTDFLRGIMFASSPDWNNEGYRLYRDFLWENSAFGSVPNITGKVDEEFKTVDDMVEYFLKKGMFNRIRNGKYETFAPVTIKEYFDDPAYGAVGEDIECYLSFKTVEATCRGTLEVRGDCAQPFNRAFMPPAFNLGMLVNIEKAQKRLKDFFDKNKIQKSNTELRNIACKGDLNEIAPETEIKSLTSDMLSIAREGLLSRKKGEEKLLEEQQL